MAQPDVVDEEVRAAVLRLANAQREFVESWRAGNDAPLPIEEAHARLDAAFRDALRP